MTFKSLVFENWEHGTWMDNIIKHLKELVFLYSISKWKTHLILLLEDIDAIYMIYIWHGNTFCITGPLWEESTVEQWLSLTRSSNAKFWFIFCQP